VAAELGRQKSGLLSGESLALYEKAVSDGSIQRDFMGTLARVLPKILRGVTQVKFEENFKDSSSTALSLQRAVASHSTSCSTMSTKLPI
jgi:hypothetical protein